MKSYIKKIDEKVFEYFNRFKQNQIINLTSRIGSFIFCLVYVVILILISIIGSSYSFGGLDFGKIAITNIAALSLNTLTVFIIKFSVRRKRKAGDYYFIQKVDPYSFPSGHVSRLAGFVFSSSLFPPLSVLFFILCISTSLARMIKKYHYFSDCYAGFVIGFFGGFISFIFSGYYTGFVIRLIPIF